MTVAVAWMTLIAMRQQPASAPTQLPAVPEVLKQAFDYRTRFRTAHFEYRRESQAVPSGARISAVVDHVEVACADGRFMYTLKGDDDGLTCRLAGTLEPGIGVRNAFHPTQRVVDKSQNVMWTHEGSLAGFGLFPADSWLDRVDFRTFGLSSQEPQRRDPAELLRSIQNWPGIRFKVARRRGDLQTVTAVEPADRESGEHLEREWEIDVRRGPSVVVARMWVVHRDGRRELWSECRNDLALKDGYWWPTSVEYQTMGVQTRIDFDRVEFDRPDHPMKIDSESLGIPIGAVIQSGMPDQASAGAPLRYVGGGNTVDLKTWEGIKGGFDLEPYHQFVARMGAMGPGYLPAWWDATDGQLGVEGVADRPDAWTVYVRRWKYRHMSNGMWKVTEPLSPQQQAAADAVLKDCQERAKSVRLRVEAELAEIDGELRTLESEPKSTEGSIDSNDRIEKLRVRRQELAHDREIGEIFGQLRRRLEALLTSHQKEATSGRLDLPKPPLRTDGSRPGKPRR